MTNFCQDCERLDIKTSGTASERPHFRQPTKYNHYDNFQTYKQTKEDELSSSKRKEELLKFNSNFTNFNLNHILTKEEFEQQSPQDIVKLRQQLCSASCDDPVESITNTGDEEIDSKRGLDESESDGKSLQKRKSLLILTRAPIQCPISVCHRTIGVTFVLSHYLRDHSKDSEEVPCQEIYTNKRTVLVFDPNVLNFRENFCLGILAYGGDANESSSRPSERGLCINNAFLPTPYEHLATHLPILIMACRTTWSALLGDKEKEVNHRNPNFMAQELLVLWLASPQTIKPIHGTVTIYDRSMTSSRSAIIQIRDLNDTQIPQNFMLKETNFIGLSHGEINILSQQRTECIHMEILINEY